MRKYSRLERIVNFFSPKCLLTAGLIGLSSIPIYPQEKSKVGANLYGDVLFGVDRIKNFGLEMGADIGNKYEGLILGGTFWTALGYGDLDSKLARKFMEELDEGKRETVRRLTSDSSKDYYYDETSVGLVGGIRVSKIAFIGKYYMVSKTIEVQEKDEDSGCPTMTCRSYKPIAIFDELEEKKEEMPTLTSNEWVFGTRYFIPFAKEKEDGSRAILGVEYGKRHGIECGVGILLDF